MSTQVKMSLRGRLPEPSFPIKFSDDDMDAIVSHVPGADRKRMMRLADVLNEWANHDLQKAFLIYPDKGVALGSVDIYLNQSMVAARVRTAK